MIEKRHILLATLGGQPQIVTFTLDRLLRNYPISEVIVIHPNAPLGSRLQRSLKRLSEEFTNDYYHYQEKQYIIHFRSQVLELDGQPIDIIVDDGHADGTLNTIHRLIGDLKRQGYYIHLSLSGGRQMMGLLAMPIATLNFNRNDHIWHIYTPDEIQQAANEGQVMHLDNDHIKLIEVPFVALGAYISPTLSFHRVQEEQREKMETLERSRCIQVVKQAKPSQLKILRAIAKGSHPSQVAKELELTVATVSSHCTTLYVYCREAWDIPRNEQIDYHFLQLKFAEYFQTQE
jgi:CRISPR-associated protein Csx14